jgi:hypothetical protein
VSNKQPCSLNDFVDYLQYVEHSAESLQFFLWYCDYVRRWSRLPPKEKALAPLWEPDQAVEPESRFITYSHKRERSDRMNKILTILEMEPKEEDRPGPVRDGVEKEWPLSPSPNFSRPKAASTTAATSKEGPTGSGLLRESCLHIAA